ncbi:hypothetical protein [Streptomyces sp. NPDC014894]|uniref:hypothetical protein n=1 Tax=Streptomyces sp. NPDC014894 TaxID=3364931 RepID=UPI003702FC7B
MSRLIGPYTADPCPRCFTEEVRHGAPVSAAGRDAVRHVCRTCAHTWLRPVETDIDVHDTVRADLPDRTLYGTAWQVEDDRVLVRGSGGEFLVWVERWRILVY